MKPIYHGFSDQTTTSCTLEEILEDRVASAMRTQLEKQDLDVALADRLEEWEIDGRTLLLLDVEYVQKLYPELKMGKVIRFMECVKLAREELRKAPPEVVPSEKQFVSRSRKLETSRAFDTQPQTTDVYEKGLVLPEEQSRPGNLLDPIHKYCIINANNSKELATEATRFAAACLNERVNGTIHFGVVGKSDSTEELQAGEIIGMHIVKRQCELTITDEIYRSIFP